MPLSEDRGMLKLLDDLVKTMRESFDIPLSYRPGMSGGSWLVFFGANSLSSCQGQLCKGTFKPSKEASKYSKASIFAEESTPLIMRYSTDTGSKDLPDHGENVSRGFAIRFVMSEDGHTHYNIITNNAFDFIVSTGEGFLDQFKHIRDGKMDEFLEKNPRAKYFQENQAPARSYSFATEQWHGIHAYKFTNSDGQERFFRWRIVPWQGVMKYSKADAAKKSKNINSTT